MQDEQIWYDSNHRNESSGEDTPPISPTSLSLQFNPESISISAPPLDSVIDFNSISEHGE